MDFTYFNVPAIVYVWGNIWNGEWGYFQHSIADYQIAMSLFR